MKFNPTILRSIHPNHLWLEVSENEIEEARSLASDYSNSIARQQAFLNSLCRNSLKKWLLDRAGFDRVDIPDKSSELWEFIHGFILQVEDKRIVAIPSDSNDLEGFTVQREWVDIPDLAADFYLAIQVDLDEKILHFWGFISREEVREFAELEPLYRQYLLDQDRPIDSLDILWDSCRFGESEKGAIEPLPALSETEARELIQSLSIPSLYSPRLQVHFEKWGALLNDKKWREELYRSRIQSRFIFLRNWLEEQFEKEWLDVEQFLQREPVRSREIRKRTGDMKKRIKLIDLQVQLKKVSVLLLIAIASQDNGTYRIIAQIYPVSANSVLPPNLGIAQFLPSGQELQTVISRQYDNWIQLRPFHCHEGQKFTLKVFWNDFSVVEEFIV
ncbi:DUF1822 family protein [Pannus brasiliensis CCIBt3594]|uniref:DUF1822 family protein n=1 Tax=Pannus brasiliensis CCIBt3594 TaxID=1427578 RepID=A0AAW9QMB3_9CHRO